MYRIERSAIVPYSAEQMFVLVADVNEYPKFLPWCAAAHAQERSDGCVDVTIEIAYRGIRSRFTTRNVNRAPKSIDMELVEGPFCRLQGGWTFRKLRSDACKVQLQLQYQFATGLIGRAIAPAFDFIAGSMVDGFSRRAEILHGR